MARKFNLVLKDQKWQVSIKPGTRSVSVKQGSVARKSFPSKKEAWKLAVDTVELASGENKIVVKSAAA